MLASFLKKNKVEVIALLLLLVLYLLTRLYQLTNLPIFTDEAIYLRWAQISLFDAKERFISLTDGKQPLFVWLMMISMKFFEDPLYAGRFVSVVAGLGTTIGLFFVGWELFRNVRIGVVSAALYVLYPFGLVYDRMALYDSSIGMFSVWGLYLAILLVRYIRLDVALLLGIEAGIGVLNKTNAFFILYLLPFSLLIFDWTKKNRLKRLLQWTVYIGIAVVIANSIYALLRLSPYYYIIEQKNAVFIYPFNEWVTHPFEFLLSNLQGLLDWIYKYMTLGLLLGAVAALFINRLHIREKILLLVWFAAPFVALALFGRLIYPRYILFMTLPLLVLVSYTIVQLFVVFKQKMLAVILTVAILILPLIAHYYVLFDFARAPIPRSDVSQYYTDWPSGVGIRESVAFFREKARNEKIYVATAGTFGLLPYAYELYFWNDPSVEVKGFWPINQTPPDELYEIAKEKPVYIVMYQPCHICSEKGLAPESWNVEEVFQIQKVAPETFFTVYRLK